MTFLIREYERNKYYLPFAVGEQHAVVVCRWSLTFDDAMVLSEFYRDYSNTNSLIEAAEKAEYDTAHEQTNRLLVITVSAILSVVH